MFNQEEYKKVWGMLKQHNPALTNNSGIYFMTRFSNGFKFGYIGQAKHIMDRLVQHFFGYDQHIDKSLKKHKLASKDNPEGWNINCLEFPEDQLNEKEQLYIKMYANAGYQLRNKTSGSQDGAKFGIADNKSSKSYRDGVVYGYEKARKEVKELFDKYLTFSQVKLGTRATNAYLKFSMFIGGKDAVFKTDDGESKD